MSTHCLCVHMYIHILLFVHWLASGMCQKKKQKNNNSCNLCVLLHTHYKKCEKTQAVVVKYPAK